MTAPAPLDVATILTALRDHAVGTGLFTAVHNHEPRAITTGLLVAGIWWTSSMPARGYSGLDATTMRVLFTCRVYTNANDEPRDEIDVRLLGGVDALMRAYTGDFTLGGLIREVDVLGRSGVPLAATSGYTPEQQNTAEKRIATITLPLIVNDLYEQET